MPLLFEPVIAQLLAQRRAVDAEHRRGATLVAFAMPEHFDEQRNLEFAQRDLVEVLGAASVEIAEVSADGCGDMIAQGGARFGAMIVAIGSGVQAMSPGFDRRCVP